MPYSETNGVTIYYDVSGSGPPLLFIHANPFDHRLWIYQIAEFSTRFRCIAVDIRGYGRSDKPTTPFSLTDMTADVLGVLRRERVDKAVVCGCSVGSGMALLMGLETPDLVQAMILVGGNAKGSDAVNARIRGFMETQDLEAFLAGYIRELVAPDYPATHLGDWALRLFTQQARHLNQHAIAQIHRARARCDLSDRLSAIRLPTMVINGQFDNSLAAGRHTAHAIASARHVVLAGAGHACPIEDPAAFNAAVSTFLQDHGLWPATAAVP